MGVSRILDSPYKILFLRTKGGGGVKTRKTTDVIYGLPLINLSKFKLTPLIRFKTQKSKNAKIVSDRAEREG